MSPPPKAAGISMHEVVMSHRFWPGSGLQLGHTLRASSGLVGCARAEGRRARRTREVMMDFMFVDCLDSGLAVMGL